MTCELMIRDVGDAKEYLCNDVAVARLILRGDYILNVDVVKPWNYPVTKELSINNVTLIYWRNNFMGYDAEFVGYDDGSKRELISIRIFLGSEVSDDEVKDLILKIIGEFGNG